MASIMDMVRLQNRPSRNGFDLSKKNLFTAKVGELLPVYVKECIPSDRFTIDLKAFTRTQPINTAAFTRFREYFDFYFVPTNVMWNKYNTWFTTMYDEAQQAANLSTNVTLSETHPYLTCSQMLAALNAMKSTSGSTPTPYTNEFGYNRGNLSFKLMEYLGYKAIAFANMSDDAVTFQRKYNNNVNLNPFPLLAYQKIYNDFYRNTQWERAAAYTWNLDYMYDAGGQSMNINTSAIDYSKPTMFDLRYCNWKKDLFMGLLPNSQYGDAASVDLNTLLNPVQSDVLQFISDARGVTNGSNAEVQTILGSNYLGVDGATSKSIDWKISAETAGRIASSIGLSSENLQSAFTILALRTAEAKQRWSEIIQSNQKDVPSQFKAVWNVDVSAAYSNRARHLGGTSSTMDISEVVNNNLADPNSDANIAGKGIGVSQGKIEFSTDVPGYLMCIYHCVPLLDYAYQGLSRQMTKISFTDYANPLFDRTGMVQVTGVELLNAIDSDGEAPAIPNLLGYAPRYYDYKTDIDEVNGAFVHGGLDSWVAPFSSEYVESFFEDNGLTLNSLSWQFMKVNPAVVNPIFGVDANSLMSTDQLLINCSFDIKAVRPLDVNGLPY